MVDGRRTCEVWWLATGLLDWGRFTPLLDSGERGRLEALRREDDRERFVLAAALARAVLGRHIGLAPAAVRLDRRCARCGAPHGKPRLLGAEGPEISVTHSGRLVGVAVAASVPVGLDVESAADARAADGVADAVLAAEERRALDRAGGTGPGARRLEAFLRLWTRKEALTKMTGAGLAERLRDVRVSGPDEPARLLAWPGHERFVGGATLVDLDPPVPGHVAALAVAAPGAAAAEHDGAALLTG